MKKLTILLIVISLLAGCRKSPVKLKIGLIKPSLDHFPVEYALEKGLLTEDDVELIFFNSGWETNEALVANQIDLAIMPFTYGWVDVSQGKDVKIISFLERESDGIVTKTEIDSIPALDGKKVGVLRASTLDVFAAMMQEHHGITFEQVAFRTPMDMASALRSGEVDALSYYVPPIFNLGEDFHILHWYSDDDPMHPCCDLIANGISLENKREQIKKFYEVIRQSVEGLNQNQEESYQIAEKYFNITAQGAAQSLEHQKFLTGLEANGKEFEIRTIEKMIEMGYIKNSVKAEDVYHAFE